MPGQPVLPKGSPPPLAPYSPGFRSGQFVCTAGMLAMDASGNLVGEGDAGAQTRQVMENIKARFWKRPGARWKMSSTT